MLLLCVLIDILYASLLVTMSWHLLHSSLSIIMSQHLSCAFVSHPDIFCMPSYRCGIMCRLSFLSLWCILTSFVCLHITVRHLDIICQLSCHLSVWRIIRSFVYFYIHLLCGFISCQDIFCMLSYLTLTSFMCFQLSYRHLSYASISCLHWCTVTACGLSAYWASLWWELSLVHLVVLFSPLHDTKGFRGLFTDSR